MIKVTIHSYNTQWRGAEIVGVGKDSLRGIEDVVIVHHAAFVYDPEFYAEADVEGRHFNVGNAAFWLTYEEMG